MSGKRKGSTLRTLSLAAIGGAIGLVIYGVPHCQGHRQGVIDATTGAWKAEQHEATGKWIVWRVERKEGEDGE